ncbi:MAG: dTDP-4-dehydrorhamnose reductase [Odoribacter splanchnicus]
MSNILVTGSNGQLGNEIQRLAATDRDNSYVFTDVAELDITDLDAIRRCMTEHRISIVVNCAAYTNVDKAEDDEETAGRINHLAVENLAVACKEQGAVLIHVSTDYVFQGDGNLPCREDEPTNPLGVYGKTKLAGEKAIEKVGCRYLIFRTAWLYSSFGNNFVKTMRRLTAGRDQLSVVFDQVGTPTYAGDLAALIVYVIKTGKYKDYRGIYHFSNEGVCSWYDFAKEIAALSGNICDIRPCHSDEFPSKVKRPAFSVLDKTKIKKDFDYVIPYWRDSLVKCIHELDKIGWNLKEIY